MDESNDDRETELGTKSSVEACSSLGCLSPLASTDALLPSFQPDDAGVTSPQLSPSAEHTQRNYPGSVPQLASRRNRSPRSDELYPAPGHASSYAGHSPRSEVTPAALRRSSFSERSGSPRSTNAVVEDLTSHPKYDRPFVETQRDQRSLSPNTGDSNVRREIAKSKMDLLRVDTSLTTVSRQSRESAANHVSCILAISALS